MARKRSSTSRKPAAGVILLVAGLLLSLSFLPKATGLAVVLGRWQRLLLGDLALLLPMATAAAGAYLIVAGGKARVTRGIVAITAFMLAGVTAYHARVAPGSEIVAGKSSGLIGGGLVWAVRASLGEIGLWVVISVAVIGGIALASRLSLLELLDLVKNAVSAALASLRAGAAALAAGFTRLAQLMMLRLARHTVPVTEPSLPPPSPVEQMAAVATVEPPNAEVESRARRPRPEPAKADSTQESLKLEVPSGGYQLPHLSLLTDLPAIRGKGKTDPAEVARALEQTLASFDVEARVIRWEQGPVVTRFEVQPAPGVRVQKISSLTNDIALALAAPSVRIEAPIPGKSAVGIELPNQKTSLVHIKEILSTEEYQRATTPLVVAVGKDIAGHPILADLAEMPHLLLAGA
ncbi:MAG: DNA translocase FtsK 4TM domain-containing protein, partial [Armatimonadetes bacterium]|nr:DNA translocase FtsK 4TM domain-containing protein [Armatimonadota bacterium]